YFLEKLKAVTELAPQPFWEQPDTILWRTTLPRAELAPEPEVERLLSSGQWTVSGKAENPIVLRQALATGHYRIRTTILDVTGDTLTSIAPFKVVNPSQSVYTLGEGLSLVNLTGNEVRQGGIAEFLVGS